ncbi:MAG TPA: cyanate transporter, partial [Mycoplana sp.]|nr:cyanate transporter [Mycoplana sp.]
MNLHLKDADTTAEDIDRQLIDAEADSVPPPAPPAPGNGLARVILGASLVLIAFNLRPVFSSASALLPEIRSTLQLSPLGVSL